ncbi:MAG: sigma factor-like helix-turn-helix DNA-binding protein [Eubacterium ventriosum]
MKWRKRLLYKAIEKLNHREKVIVEMRYGLNNKDGEEMTQKEVADFLGISQSYISRLRKENNKTFEKRNFRTRIEFLNKIYILGNYRKDRYKYNY